MERAWVNLNPAERYFTLLETWLLRGLAEIIGEGRRGLFVIPDSFGGWVSFFGNIPDEGLQIAGDKRDVPLRVGQQMVYLFDFGDRWEFDVILERVNPVEESVETPTILDRRGESPEQYPRWDKEW